MHRPQVRTCDGNAGWGTGVDDRGPCRSFERVVYVVYCWIVHCRRRYNRTRSCRMLTAKKGLVLGQRSVPCRVPGIHVTILSIHLVHGSPKWNIKWLNYRFIQFSKFIVHGSDPGNGLVSCPSCPGTHFRLYDNASPAFWSLLKILVYLITTSHSTLTEAYCCGYEIHIPH